MWKKVSKMWTPKSDEYTSLKYSLKQLEEKLITDIELGRLNKELLIDYRKKFIRIQESGNNLPLEERRSLQIRIRDFLTRFRMYNFTEISFKAPETRKPHVIVNSYGSWSKISNSQKSDDIEMEEPVRNRGVTSQVRYENEKKRLVPVHQQRSTEIPYHHSSQGNYKLGDTRKFQDVRDLEAKQLEEAKYNEDVKKRMHKEEYTQYQVQQEMDHSEPHNTVVKIVTSRNKGTGTDELGNKRIHNDRMYQKPEEDIEQLLPIYISLGASSIDKYKNEQKIKDRLHQSNINESRSHYGEQNPSKNRRYLTQEKNVGRQGRRHEQMQFQNEPQNRQDSHLDAPRSYYDEEKPSRNKRSQNREIESRNTDSEQSYQKIKEETPNFHQGRQEHTLYQNEPQNKPDRFHHNKLDDSRSHYHEEKSFRNRMGYQAQETENRRINDDGSYHKTKEDVVHQSFHQAGQEHIQMNIYQNEPHNKPDRFHQSHLDAPRSYYDEERPSRNRRSQDEEIESRRTDSEESYQKIEAETRNFHQGRQEHIPYQNEPQNKQKVDESRSHYDEGKSSRSGNYRVQESENRRIDNDEIYYKTENVHQNIGVTTRQKYKNEQQFKQDKLHQSNLNEPRSYNEVEKLSRDRRYQAQYTDNRRNYNDDNYYKREEDVARENISLGVTTRQKYKNEQMKHQESRRFYDDEEPSRDRRYQAQETESRRIDNDWKYHKTQENIEYQNFCQGSQEQYPNEGHRFHQSSSDDSRNYYEEEKSSKNRMDRAQERETRRIDYERMYQKTGDFELENAQSQQSANYYDSVSKTYLQPCEDYYIQEAERDGVYAKFTDEGTQITGPIVHEVRGRGRALHPREYKEDLEYLPERDQTEIAEEAEEPLEILDVHQYFQDDLDLRTLDSSIDAVTQIIAIAKYARTFEPKIYNFSEAKYSLGYFILDEKMMRLIEHLDKLKCKADPEATKHKIEVIDYIKDLQAILDKRATDE